MSNDLDLYSPGDLAPYSPSQPLAPAPSPDWNSGPDLLPAHHAPGESRPLVFGQPLPPGVSIEQVMQAYNQLGGVFCADFLKLGHNISHPQKAVKWFLDAIKNPPAKQQYKHPYNLYEHKGDFLFEAFAAYAHGQGFSQKFVTDTAWWVSEAGRKLSQQNTSSQTPRMAPQTSDPTAQLTDAQYDQLITHNERVKSQTINKLAAKYGDHGYQQVIALAQAHLERLPVADRKYFDAWTGDFPWTHMLSTFEAIDGLYAMAVGANSIAKTGTGLAQEIAAYEAMLRIPSERAKYMRDPQMQARFRELLRLKAGS
ncbi:hypothetical protein [Pseudomonas putida]|uniref:hypothetical protein n=1 Tax=Pseudomonas putida TaxID=303 RepID=UPI000CD3B2DF|nr:hypothetical protein [Pseudomonas putida]POG00122.1 hypothetical protein BGP83_23600 [Pseudomonas putida]